MMKALEIMVLAMLSASYAALPASGQSEKSIVSLNTCEHILTGQTRRCEVERIFICVGGAFHFAKQTFDKDQKRVMEITSDAYTNDTRIFFPEFDVKFRIVESKSEKLDASFLLSGQKKEFFWDFEGSPDVPVQIEGTSHIEDSTTIISGRSLETVTKQAAVRLSSSNGLSVQRISSTSFYDRQLGILLNGKNIVSGDGETHLRDYSPAQVISKGEAGFLDLNPQYGCGGGV